MELAGRNLRFGERTYVMGVINLTPDSFSGDGLRGDAAAALQQARRFVAEGADILDIGGESTRPGAAEVGGQAEIDRVAPAISAIAAELEVPISIDTRHADVAAAALAAGATMVNDVTGLQGDPAMAGVVAKAGVPVVLQHIQGTPQNMQQNPEYEDVVEDVWAGLRERLRLAEAAGIAREQCIIDPGIGFGKKLEHNLRLFRRLGELRTLGCPILVGPSRKSFIGRLLGTEAQHGIEGTAAAVAICIAHGADLVRVHDVGAMVRVVKVADALVRGRLA
ncbi:MAG: dihydropteroate synthase [Armatimonadetes bacterium]|nr:dihydropteroate synthase [Armatimonadota bacterium]